LGASSSLRQDQAWSEEEKEVSYLNFVEIDISKRKPTPKTLLVLVNSARTGDPLGEIKWYGPWRQYCFFPLENTIFNNGCLDEISTKCGAMTNKHKS
jgi:hypothetical protein